MKFLTYRKTAHPRNSEEPQGYEPTDVADTLNVFDNSEGRTPILIVTGVDNIKERTVIPLEGNGSRPSHKGNGYGKPGDPSFTLNAVEHHGVAYGFEPGVAKRLNPEGRFVQEGTPTLRSNMGDNQTAVAVIVLNDQGGSQMSVTEDVTATLRAQEHGHQPLCLEMTSTKNTVVKDGISPTLTARMGTGGNQVNAVLASVDCRNCTEDTNTNGTLQAKSNGGWNLNSNQVCRVGSAVRRLTPKECERLQSFPDDWTDIGEWIDSRGKKHKPSDTNRYKAIGNSIALPFWQWLLGRINIVQLEETGRPATLGSLFSGIGGFELCGERAGMTPVWASEVDEFCMAVTKKHFSESDETDAAG